MKKNILIDFEVKKIQEVRVIQALAETDFAVNIPLDQEYKFKSLMKIFGGNYIIEKKITGKRFTTLVKINHAKPLTSIGSIERTLIFPHSVCNDLRNRWREKRKYSVSFTGLMTDSRRVLLKNWIKKNMGINEFKFPDEESKYYKIIAKVIYKLIKKSFPKRIKSVFIWSSNRGRGFPAKSWDSEYYENLCNSQFVLCPSGDYIWSYRFFEAILCGAIPIVEMNYCAYKGFRFYLMSDKSKDLIWCLEDAEYNYNLCLEKVTIPLTRLNSELTKR